MTLRDSAVSAYLMARDRLASGAAMGFHWQWFAVRRTGPGVVDKLLEMRRFRPSKVLRGLTLSEVDEVSARYGGGDNDVLSACEFRGWTFLTGTVLFYEHQVIEVAKALNADACEAWAESVSWSVLMEYAKPDGTFRRRAFELGTAGEPGEFEVELLPRSTLEAPLRRDDEGRETTVGSPLPGEPEGLVIADGERLAALLAAVGVPVGDLMGHYAGTFDWTAMREVPGAGAEERAFTTYLSGPIEEDSNAAPSRPDERGWLRLRNR